MVQSFFLPTMTQIRDTTFSMKLICAQYIMVSLSFVHFPQHRLIGLIEICLLVRVYLNTKLFNIKDKNLFIYNHTHSTSCVT